MHQVLNSTAEWSGTRAIPNIAFTTTTVWIRPSWGRCSGSMPSRSNGLTHRHGIPHGNSNAPFAHHKRSMFMFTCWHLLLSLSRMTVVHQWRLCWQRRTASGRGLERVVRVQLLFPVLWRRCEVPDTHVHQPEVNLISHWRPYHFPPNSLLSSSIDRYSFIFLFVHSCSPRNGGGKCFGSPKGLWTICNSEASI